MCTCLIAGRNASATGRVLLAANDDWDGVPGVLFHEPAARHAPGEVCVLTGGGTIPQVPETRGFSYTACRYDIGTLDKAWAFGMNDRGVAAAGTGASAFKDIPCADALLEADDVLRLILARADTARHGIRLIGDLAAAHGLRPSGMEGCESMATFAVADENEGWFLEMAPGDHWVAVRVPDGEAGVRVNAFGAHGVDLTDGENVMASPGLADYARARGWWEGTEEDFDFAAAYGADVSPNEWGPEKDPMNMRRRWRALCLLSGQDRDEVLTEYSVRPDRRLTLSDLTDVLRDVYEDTPYDLRRAPAAGRYGNPFHDDAASYALCRHATVTSVAADFARPGEPALWAAMSTPAVCAYIPLWADVDGLPAVCWATAPAEPSLWWEWKELCLLAQRRYERSAARIGPAVRDWERAMADRLDEEAAALSALPAEVRRARRTELTARHIHEARALCRDLKTRLLEQY